MIDEQHNEVYVCGEEEVIGLPEYPTPDEVGAAAAELSAAAAACRMRFNRRGPGNLRKMEKTTVQTSDGFDADVEWLYTWAPAPDQAAHTVAEVEEFVRHVFRHSQGWMRAGIAFRRVPLDEAQCVVKYVTEGRSVCGAGAAGCCSGPDSRRLIEMVSGTWGNHKGLYHELAHAFALAKHNNNPRCPSVMGGSPPGIRPTESDIVSMREFALGKTPVG